MSTKLALALILSAVTCGTGRADTLAPSPANLLQEFTCPTGNCQTQCVGPGGTLNFSAKDVKVYQYSEHPRRIWVDEDGQIYVLGDDDRCHFGGTATIDFVNPPVVVSPIPPVPPQCTCIGNQCYPPGCNKPLRN